MRERDREREIERENLLTRSIPKSAFMGRADSLQKKMCKYYQMELHNIAIINTTIEGAPLHIKNNVMEHPVPTQRSKRVRHSGSRHSEHCVAQ
jgi:hypothetical protein